MGGPARPSISVLLPVRNGARCVSAAMESVLAQTWEDFELLVIENGSTDGTRAVVEGVAARDRRVRVLALAEAGIVGALNYGLSEARGAFVARMDADDVCAPVRFERQMEWMGRSGAGLVSCLVRQEGGGKGYAAYVEWINTLRTHEEIALNRFVESPLAHPTVLFRREVAERLGAWRDGQFPEDYELWLRWLEGGVRMEKVPEVLMAWRDRPGRLSRVDARYGARAFFACKAGYLARWLREAPVHGRALLFWGAGRETRRRLGPLLESGVKPAGWIDVQPAGRIIDGAPVHSHEELPGPERCFVISFVTNRGARGRIAEWLDGRGFRAGADYVLAG